MLKSDFFRWPQKALFAVLASVFLLAGFAIGLIALSLASVVLVTMALQRRLSPTKPDACLVADYRVHHRR